MTNPVSLHQHWLNRPLLLAPHALHQLQSPLSAYASQSSTHQRITVVPVLGPLVKRGSFLDALLGFGSYEEVEARLQAALADSSIAGIILDIDSPGGDAAGAFDLADRIYEARSTKPVWAIANDSAFSAAYAIGSAAEKLFLTRTGGVGSIGVLAAHVDQSAYDEKQGVKITTVYAGARKNDFNRHEPLSTDALTSLQAEVDRLYSLFVETVARNRNLSADAVRGTEAALLFGEDAVAANLADGIHSLPQVLHAFASHLSLNHTPKKEKKPMSEQDPPIKQAETPPVDINAVKQQATAEALASFKAEQQEIILACKLAGMPEQAAALLEEGVTANAAKQKLLAMKAENQSPEISSQVLPQTGTGQTDSLQNNPLLMEAKNRAGGAQ